MMFVFVIALFQINQSVAASSELRFAKHFFHDTFIYSARELSDGGYLLAGTRDLIPIVIRLDPVGEVQWVRKFDPGPNLNGWFLNVIETTDGGFLAVGETFQIGGFNFDPVIVKLSSRGKIVWQQKVPGNYDDHLQFVMETSDGGFLAAGITGSFSVAGGADCWVIKLNKSGKLLWSKAFGREGFDKFFGAVEMDNGDYILAGSVDIFGTTEWVKGFVSSVDPNGNV
ncbi:hypothetical protein L0222_18220, partial [bacterium]|nr:hypothetical protein [bacterium]